MSGKGFFSLVLCAGVALFSACRKGDSNPLAPPDQVQLTYSHADTVEAGEFAMWLSGKLRAPDSLISALLYNLNYLRSAFGDSTRYADSVRVPFARRFMAPWNVSELEVMFDSATAEKVKEGQYHAWDSLEAYLRPDSLGRIYGGWITIFFKPDLHPRRLTEFYRTLPGIIYAEPSYFIFISEVTFPIFPRFDGKTMSYLFTDGSALGPFWYFKYVDGVPHYVGEWNPPVTVPTWWPEAVLNVKNFSVWDGM